MMVHPFVFNAVTLRVRLQGMAAGLIRLIFSSIAVAHPRSDVIDGNVSAVEAFAVCCIARRRPLSGASLCPRQSCPNYLFSAQAVQVVPTYRHSQVDKCLRFRPSLDHDSIPL